MELNNQQFGQSSLAIETPKSSFYGQFLDPSPREIKGPIGGGIRPPRRVMPR